MACILYILELSLKVQGRTFAYWIIFVLLRYDTILFVQRKKYSIDVHIKIVMAHTEEAVIGSRLNIMGHY